MPKKVFAGRTKRLRRKILAQDPRFRAIGTTKNTSLEGSGYLPGVAKSWDVLLYDLSLDYKEWI